MTDISLGIDTYGSASRAVDGSLTPRDQVLRDAIAKGMLADQVGMDFIGSGEHHRYDFAVSSPEMRLRRLIRCACSSGFSR